MIIVKNDDMWDKNVKEHVKSEYHILIHHLLDPSEEGKAITQVMWGVMLRSSRQTLILKILSGCITCRNNFFGGHVALSLPNTKI